MTDGAGDSNRPKDPAVADQAANIGTSGAETHSGRMLYLQKLLGIGHLLLDQFNAETLAGIAGKEAHALVELRPQFVNVWWWLLGSSILIKEPTVIKGVYNLWPQIIGQWKQENTFPKKVDDVVVLLNIYLTDIYLAYLFPAPDGDGISKKRRRTRVLTREDDAAVRKLILNKIVDVPLEWLESLAIVSSCSPPPVQAYYTINLTGDGRHVDVRMIYSAILVLSMIKFRDSEVGLGGSSVLPEYGELRQLVRSVLSYDQRKGLLNLLSLCYCPVQKCFTGSPFGEPHAGYVFCTASATVLLSDGVLDAVSFLDRSGPVPFGRGCGGDVIRAGVEGGVCSSARGGDAFVSSLCHPESVQQRAHNTKIWLRKRVPACRRLSSDTDEEFQDVFQDQNYDDLCNGRPGKRGDVCYCFWVLAGLRSLKLYEEGEDDDDDMDFNDEGDERSSCPDGSYTDGSHTDGSHTEGGYTQDRDSTSARDSVFDSDSDNGPKQKAYWDPPANNDLLVPDCWNEPENRRQHRSLSTACVSSCSYASSVVTMREGLLRCRNPLDGSMAKNADCLDSPDIFHTFFGNLALSFKNVHHLFGAPKI
ncbi:hypothetical protein GNI_054800 [Gregarina niphandrodes]|uniref:Geranylgeranyl transferase type II subunit beta n=1 Tax=Gregarina niphandrodes TaxID=110365 RepID=A0A023B925_GRENI|nr:hypothetical protein GNI_054800 [Gregarina niphandrodes]EZG70681.1 hypothetical protein GNI_054800 [Gregarina niphandrodes]|eukprot:XP_011129901.1 hypothetical protein GNI_054800 [Gregarina niphandrodes]